MFALFPSFVIQVPNCLRLLNGTSPLIGCGEEHCKTGRESCFFSAAEPGNVSVFSLCFHAPSTPRLRGIPWLLWLAALRVPSEPCERLKPPTRRTFLFLPFFLFFFSLIACYLGFFCLPIVNALLILSSALCMFRILLRIHASDFAYRDV